MPLKFIWKIPIKASPDTLWRYISDTNRINQYAGLPEFTFRYVAEPDGGSRQIGETRYMGLRLQWDEHPFEWIEGQYFEIARVYHNGPLRQLRTSVTLHPQDGGTLVEQVIACDPRWPFAIPVMYWELAFSAKRRFIAAYRKIEQYLNGVSETPLEPKTRQPVPAGRIQIIRQRMAEAAGRQWLAALIEAIETLSDDELDMMRPFVFADRWKADRREVLKLFLHSAQAGLLDMSWDVICPGCRGAKERHATLKNLREQAHCNACNIRYTADFAQSVEVTFRPNPAIRPIQVARYCSGGPINAPHVLAQQRIPARRSKTLKMTLSPWRYYLRSPKLSKQTLVTVQPDSTVSSAIVRIHRPTLEPETLEIAREVALTFENNDDKEVVVMLERAAGRENAATAAMVIAMNEFRTLFSEEVLSPETAISIGAVTLMFTDLKASTKLYETLGEAPAYALVRRHFDLLRNCIANNEGAVVKTIGDAVMAAFMDPARALAAALAMHRTINDDNAARGEPLLTLKIGIHYGACIAVNLNDTLDYFGTAANIAARVQKESLGGDVVITQEVWADPAVQELLAETPHRYETCEVVIRGLSGARKVFRIQPYLKMTIEH